MEVTFNQRDDAVPSLIVGVVCACCASTTRCGNPGTTAPRILEMKVRITTFTQRRASGGLFQNRQIFDVAVLEYEMPAMNVTAAVSERLKTIHPELKIHPLYGAQYLASKTGLR